MMTKEFHDLVLGLPSERRGHLADRLSLDWSEADVAEDGSFEEDRAILEDLLECPLAERQLLADELYKSLAADDWERACVAEIEVRMARYRQGQEKSHSFAELLKVLKK